MVSKRKIITLLGMAVIAMLLAGCSAPETEPEQAAGEQVASEIFATEIPELTPTAEPTVTSTVTLEPTLTPTPKPTLTPTPEPIATQQPEPTPTQESTATLTPEPTPEIVDKAEELQKSFVDTGDSELNDMCDAILQEIINVDMTEREKAYAIYQWVENNVKYRGTSDTGDWIAGSKYALAYKKGNCYAFYAASRGLLTRAGFENVEATEYNFTHYWNIVKVDGVWRHFDTTTGWGTERFLWTGTQISEYSYYIEGWGRDIKYEWNPEGCPDTD